MSAITPGGRARWRATLPGFAAPVPVTLAATPPSDRHHGDAPAAPERLGAA